MFIRESGFVVKDYVKIKGYLEICVGVLRVETSFLLGVDYLTEAETIELGCANENWKIKE